MDLGLTTKYLTGVLENGDRYKIILKDEPSDYVNDRRIISVVKRVYDKTFGIYFFNDAVYGFYKKGESCKEILKDTFLRAERKFEIKTIEL